jgi:UDP-N-acetylmuramyl pentapeptide synthase
MWPRSIKELSQIIGAEIVGTGDKDAQISCVATDSRKVGSGDLFVPLKGDVYDALDFVNQVAKVSGCWVLVPRQWLLSKGSIAAAAGGKATFRSPDQDLNNGCYLVVDDVVSAFRMLAANMRGVPKTEGSPVVLAVGGSNGKTTTKEMVVAMLGGPAAEMVSTYKSENGFIGIPKTLCTRSMTAQVRRLVLEVGIDEVGSMAQHLEIVRPDVALLTSLSHEHLEGLGSFANVVAEEMVLMDGPWVRIWQGADPVIAENMASKVRAGDWLVVPSEVSSKDVAPSPLGCLMVSYAVETERDLSQSIELAVSLIDTSTRPLELFRPSLSCRENTTQPIVRWDLPRPSRLLRLSAGVRPRIFRGGCPRRRNRFLGTLSSLFPLK